MSEPKPMDPEDLDDLRREAECGNLGEAVVELLSDRDLHAREAERLRAALDHIAKGNLSPCITYARRILEGDSIEEAHRANVAEWKL